MAHRDAELTCNAALFPHRQKCITRRARQNSDGTFILDRYDRVRHFQVHGDGTVYKESAILTDIITHLPLQHGDVAKAQTALEAVTEIVRDDINPGLPQGEAGCGLSAPDLVQAVRPWQIHPDGCNITQLTMATDPDEPMAEAGD
ncbi:hypothetical protein OG239_05205 [Streptomyces sp. NBC_00868]|uniref:hypothetical protein n=1 Tax=Streptomyces sp. NBC_00868 TaxID=2903683 RepID=UPI003866BD61|nr:hypothetical protein OG239_05205 [Streptomyces sp. NBC_00868]